MSCESPRIIWLKRDLPINFQEYTEKEQKKFTKPAMMYRSGYYPVAVPCGHCLGCKLDHASEWATRITTEARQWEKCCFITLTYNNGLRKTFDGQTINKLSLPINQKGQMTLFKKDVQDFLKRLRWHEKGIQEWENPRNGKKERPIRYLVCGEYGPKGGRPHYHMALFNYEPDDLKPYKQNKQGDWLYTSKKLQSIWGNGFVVIGKLSYKSASYIARYTMKKAYSGERQTWTRWGYDYQKQKRYKIKSNYQKQKPQAEFIQMSTGVGLGRLWWEENKEFCKKWGYISIKIGDKVQHKPLPKYFKKLWEKEDWNSYHIWRYENIINGIKKYEEILAQENFEMYFDKDLAHRRKEAEILAQKAIYLKRNNFT